MTFYDYFMWMLTLNIFHIKPHISRCHTLHACVAGEAAKVKQRKREKTAQKSSSVKLSDMDELSFALFHILSIVVKVRTKIPPYFSTKSLWMSTTYGTTFYVSLVTYNPIYRFHCWTGCPPKSSSEMVGVDICRILNTTMICKKCIYSYLSNSTMHKEDCQSRTQWPTFCLETYTTYSKMMQVLADIYLSM